MLLCDSRVEALAILGNWTDFGSCGIIENGLTISVICVPIIVNFKKRRLYRKNESQHEAGDRTEVKLVKSSGRGHESWRG